MDARQPDVVPLRVVGQTRWRGYTASELMSTKFVDPFYLDGLYIPHPGRTMIWGAPGSFKTWWMMRRLCEVASRGFQVVACLGEGNAKRIQGRLGMLCPWVGTSFVGLGSRFWTYIERVDLLTKDGPVFLEQIVREADPKVIVFVPLASFFWGDENRAEEVKPFVHTLNNLVDRGISIVLVHHATKEYMGQVRRMRGSSAWEGWADAVYQLELDRRRPRHFRLKNEKMRDDDVRPKQLLKLDIDEINGIVDIEAVPDKPDLTKVEVAITDSERVTDLLKKQGTPLTATQVRETLKWRGTKVREVLDDLVADGTLVLEKDGSSKKYSLPK